MRSNNSYSSIPADENVQYRWHRIPRTRHTQIKRNQIKAQMDRFTSFSWRGVDAWENFGAFIINNKDLKFFNGSQWDNQYSKPQFSSQTGQLTGIDFKTASFSFTIGVYWFSEEEYRMLLDWLNPYEINELSFGFEPNYYYQVKLASISEGNRYIIGKENLSNFNLPGFYNFPSENNLCASGGTYISPERYYTELKLTFDLQGDSCAYKKAPIQWYWQNSQAVNTTLIYRAQCPGIYFSNLDFPIEADLQLLLKDNSIPDNLTPIVSSVTLSVLYYSDPDASIGSNPDKEYQLFNCSLEFLPLELNEAFHIKYTSEDGLMFWSQGESRFHVLSTLSTISTGSRVVNSYESQIFNIPGNFNVLDSSAYNFRFQLKIENSDQSYALRLNEGTSTVVGRGRTNVI